MPTYDADFDAKMKDLFGQRVYQEQYKKAVAEAEAKAEQEEFDRRHSFKGAVEGLATTVSDYFTGLGQAWAEYQRASMAYNDADIYDYAGANDDFNVNPKDIPVMNEYQMDAFRWKINAGKALAGVVGRGVGTVAGLAGLAASGAGLAGLATGSTALTGAASTLSTVAGAGFLASLPMDTMNITEGVLTATHNTDFSDETQRGAYAENLTNTVLPMVPFFGDIYSSLRRLSGRDEEWNTLWRENPGAAYAQLAVDIGQVATPIAYKALHSKLTKTGLTGMKQTDAESVVANVPPPSKGKKSRKKQQERAQHLMDTHKGEAPDFINDTVDERMVNARMDNLKQTGDAMAEQVSKGKIRPMKQSRAERIVTNLAKDIKDNGASPVRVKEPPLVSLDIADDPGGLPVRVVAPADPKLIRADEILGLAREITAVNEGHMSRMRRAGVLGYIQNFHDGIRVANRMNLPTLSHEIGHFLDKVLGIKGSDNELVGMAKRVWGSGTYEPGQMRVEGIAEFTREYTLNPEFARQNYPEYTIKFEAALSKHPELAMKFNKYAEGVRRWYYQGGQARVGGSIFMNDVQPKVSLRDRLKQAQLHVDEHFFDGHTVIKWITDVAEANLGATIIDEKNPIRKARALKSFREGLGLALTQRSGEDASFMKALRDLTGSQWKNNTLLADVWKSLDVEGMNTKYKDWYKKIGANDTYEAFSTYLVAKSAGERTRVVSFRNLKDLQEKLKAFYAKVNAIPEGPERDKVLQDNKKAITSIKKRMVAILTTGVDPNYKLPFKLKDANEIVNGAPVEFIKSAKLMRDFNEDLLDFMVTKNLLTGKVAKELHRTYGTYIPWERVFEKDLGVKSVDDVVNSWFDNDLATATRTNGTLADVTPAIKRLTNTGSDRMIKDPLTSSVSNVFSVVSKALRNDVAKSVVDLIKDEVAGQGLSSFFVEVPDTVSANPKDRIFTVYVKGKRKAYQANDPLLYEALSMSDPAGAKNFLQLIGATAASVKRASITNSVGFALSNLVRDSFVGMVRSRSKQWLPVIPIWDSVQGVWMQHSDKHKYINAIMEISGIKNSGLRKEDKALRANIRALMGGKELAPVASEGFIRSAMYYTNKMFQGYMGSLDNIEMAPRIRELNRLMREGNSLWKSIEGAREITVDFSQGGKTSKKINTYVPFFNANMQGLKNFFGTYSGEDISRSRAVFRTALLLGAGVTLWNLNHNQEWYRNLDPDIKNRFFVLGVGDNTVMTIPKPEGFGVLISATERLLDYCADNDIEAPGYLGTYIRGSFLPSFTSCALAPIAEYVFNKDFFRDRPLVPENLKGTKPEFQYNSNTSELGKHMGYFGISPMVFDHMVQSYLGNIGSELILGGSNVLLDDGTRPAKEITRMPGVSRLFRNANVRTEPVQVFQKKLEEARNETKSRALEATGSSRRTSKFRDRDSKVLERANKNISRAYKIINEINNPKSNLNKIKKLTPEQKTDMLNEQQRKIIKYSVDALNRTGNSYYTVNND
jgi:hypothetical protein|nr:MAG TPA: Large polyvalent protein associated domain 38 [Caudoviricetes sp.]